MLVESNLVCRYNSIHIRIRFRWGKTDIFNRTRAGNEFPVVKHSRGWCSEQFMSFLVRSGETMTYRHWKLWSTVNLRGNTRTDGFKAMLKLKWLYKKKREIVRGFYMIYEWMMSTNYFILKVEYIELKIDTKYINKEL